MSWRLAIGLLATAGALASTQFASAQEPELDIDWDLDTRTVTWIGVEGAEYYNIIGSVTYLHFGSCAPGLDPAISDVTPLNETLSAPRGTYTLPPPGNPAADSIKDIQVTIEARDSAGEVLAQNGFAFTADKFCTDEDIAQELAAAGTGASPSASNLPRIVAAALAVLGAVALACGVAVRRRVAA